LGKSLDIDCVDTFSNFGNDVDKMSDYLNKSIILNVKKYTPSVSK